MQMYDPAILTEITDSFKSVGIFIVATGVVLASGIMEKALSV